MRLPKGGDGRFAMEWTAGPVWEGAVTQEKIKHHESFL